MTYRPQSIPTDGIELDAALSELVEKLAANNHDHWAQQRISEGWRYGEERDDRAKTHPDLVPYEELSESEKDCDRNRSVRL